MNKESVSSVLCAKRMQYNQVKKESLLGPHTYCLPLAIVESSAVSSGCKGCLKSLGVAHIAYSRAGSR